MTLATTENTIDELTQEGQILTPPGDVRNVHIHAAQGCIRHHSLPLTLMVTRSFPGHTALLGTKDK